MECIWSLLFLLNLFDIFTFSFEKISIDEKLYILVDQNTYATTLNKNPVTMELINILPMKLKINKEKEVINGSLKFIPLTSKIESFRNMQSSNNKLFEGDVLIYNGTYLVLCGKNQTIENGNYYIKIGNMDNMGELFSSFKNNKKITLWNSLNYDNHKSQVVPYDYYIRIINFLTWKSLTFVCFLFI